MQLLTSVVASPAPIDRRWPATIVSGAAHTLVLAAAVLLPIFASAPLPETSTARCAFSSATHHRQHPCRHRSSRAARAPVRFSIY